jgi:hypothetical protein
LSSLEENSGLEDYLPKVPYEQIQTYFPEFLKWLCTSSSTSTDSSKTYSLFNFYNVKNSGTNHPGVKVTPYDSVSQTLFEIDRSTNNIQVGTFNDNKSKTLGTVKVGGPNL